MFSPMLRTVDFIHPLLKLFGSVPLSVIPGEINGVGIGIFFDQYLKELDHLCGIFPV